MWNFLIGAAVGWFVARNPGIVQGAVQTISAGGNCPPGANCMQAQSQYPGLVVNTGGVYVGPGVVAGSANGSVSWAGCPAGQMAYQDPNTGRIQCVSAQLQGFGRFGRWRR